MGSLKNEEDTGLSFIARENLRQASDGSYVWAIHYFGGLLPRYLLLSLILTLYLRLLFFMRDYPTYPQITVVLPLAGILGYVRSHDLGGRIPGGLRVWISSSFISWIALEVFLLMDGNLVRGSSSMTRAGLTVWAFLIPFASPLWRRSHIEIAADMKESGLCTDVAFFVLTCAVTSVGFIGSVISLLVLSPFDQERTISSLAVGCFFIVWALLVARLAPQVVDHLRLGDGN